VSPIFLFYFKCIIKHILINFSKYINELFFFFFFFGYTQKSKSSQTRRKQQLMGTFTVGPKRKELSCKMWRYRDRIEAKTIERSVLSLSWTHFSLSQVGSHATYIPPCTCCLSVLIGLQQYKLINRERNFRRIPATKLNKTY
jgi:hypothetical protein